MTTQTTNKQLQKYERGDAPDLMGAYNASMDLLDNYLQGNDDTQRQNETRITALENDNTQNKADIESLKQDDAAHESRMSDLEAEDVTIHGEIDELEGRATQHETKITALEEADKQIQETHTADVERLDKLIAANRTEIEGLRRLDQIQNEQISDHDKQLLYHTEDIESNITRIGNLEGALETVKNLIVSTDVKHIDLIAKWVNTFGKQNADFNNRLQDVETNANDARSIAEEVKNAIQPAVDAAKFVDEFQTQQLPAIDEAVQNALDKSNSAWDRFADVDKRIDQIEKNGISTDRVDEVITQYIADNESELATKTEMQAAVDKKVEEEVHNYWDYYSVEFAKKEYVDGKVDELNKKIDGLTEDGSSIVTNSKLEQYLEQYVTDTDLQDTIQNVNVDNTERLDALEAFDEQVPSVYATKDELQAFNERVTQVENDGVSGEYISEKIDEYIQSNGGDLVHNSDFAELTEKVDSLPTEEWVQGVVDGKLSYYATTEKLNDVRKQVADEINPKVEKLEGDVSTNKEDIKTLKEQVQQLTTQLSAYTSSLMKYVEKSDTIEATEIKAMLEGVWNGVS